MVKKKGNVLGGLRRIFSSSKGIAALVGILGIVLVRVLCVDQETASEVTIAITTLVGLYIVGTSVEDHGRNGKEKKR